MESAAPNSESYFRSLIEDGLDIITVSTRRGILKYVSPSVRRTLGYEPAVLVGSQMFNRIHPDDRMEAMRAYARGLLHPGQPQLSLLRFRHADGTWRSLECIGKFVKDPSGSHRVIINSRDITERKESEKLRSLLFTAVEQSMESIVITDADGTIQYVNPAFERVTGYRRQEVISRNPRILKSGQHDKSFYEKIWTKLKAGQVWQGTFVNRRKDGRLFHEEGSISPIVDDSGKITNFVAVKRDISDRRNLETILRQRERMSAVGQLAAGVAHEINNPLSIILGFAQSAIHMLSNAHELIFPLQSIEREALRCKRMVSDLLTFSRERQPGMKLEDPVGMIEGAMSLIEPQTRVRNVELVRDFQDGLPELPADRHQIQQVMINLCTNAMDAMPNGGKLTVGLQAKDGDLQISVADNGSGIPPAIRERIFDPFFTTKEVGKGTGLGLSLAYEIVQKHKGRIEVQSEVGKGATFIIRLPLAPVAVETS